MQNLKLEKVTCDFFPIDKLGKMKNAYFLKIFLCIDSRQV